MFDLSGRTALVTGAGRGIGAEIARALASQGATVGVNDIDPALAASVVATIAGAGGRGIAVPGDAGDPTAIAHVVADIGRELGPVDILVTNAGVPPGGVTRVAFIDSQPDDWEPLLRLNLYGVMHCAHAVVRGMVERGWGRIIAISSDAGRIGVPELSTYAAGKAGAAGFLRSLAKEVGQSGVTCNVVSLGLIPGPWMAEETRERRARQFPVGRVGVPQDVPGAVVWLASDEASWVTGQTISVNGGYLII